MEYIEIEYNQELKALEAILSDVKRPGDFFIAGTMEIPMPRLEVKGVGTLSFPIPGPGAVRPWRENSCRHLRPQRLADRSRCHQDQWKILVRKLPKHPFESDRRSRLPGREGLRRALQDACL